MKTTQCKPCITIRTVCKLAVRHWHNFINDVRSYSRVNATVCMISHDKSMQKPLREHPTIAKIREMAKHNYNPSLAKWDSPEAKTDFTICDALRNQTPNDAVRNY